MKNTPSTINHRTRRIPPKKSLSYQFLIDFISSIENDSNSLATVMQESFSLKGEEKQILEWLYNISKCGKPIKSDIWNMAKYGEKYAYGTNEDRMMRQWVDETDKKIIKEYQITKDIYIAYLLKIESYIKDSISEWKDRFRSINNTSTIRRLLKMRKDHFRDEEDQEIFDWIVYSWCKELYLLKKITHPLHQEYINNVNRKTWSKVAQIISKHTHL